MKYWLVGWTTKNPDIKEVVVRSLARKEIIDKAESLAMADTTFRSAILFYGDSLGMWFTLERDADGWYGKPIGWDTRAVTKFKNSLVKIVEEFERRAL